MYLMSLPVPTSEVSVSPEDTSRKIAELLAGNAEQARLGGFLGLIAVVLLVVFFSHLFTSLRTAAGTQSAMPVLALAGGILLATVLLLEIGIAYASSEVSAVGPDTAVAKFFVLWDWNSAALFAPPFAIALLGTTVVAWASRVLPDWYRWTSTVLLVLLLLVFCVMQAPGLATLPGAVWILVTSVLLLASGGEPGERVEPDPVSA